MRPDMGGKLPANKTAILQFPCLSDTDGAPVRRRCLDGRGSFAWHNPRKMCIRNYNIGLSLCDNGSTASFTHCFHFQGPSFSFRLERFWSTGHNACQHLRNADNRTESHPI